MVNELFFLLKGAASEYYWAVLEQEKHTVTWALLKKKFQDRFRDPRQDLDILRAIDARHQKKGENFMEFYTEIQTMSVPLSEPMKEKDLIILLMRNMSTELQYKLAGETFHSVSNLVGRCVAIEESWTLIRKHNYNSTSRRRRSKTRPRRGRRTGDMR